MSILLYYITHDDTCKTLVRKTQVTASNSKREKDVVINSSLHLYILFFKRKCLTTTLQAQVRFIILKDKLSTQSVKVLVCVLVKHTNQNVGTVNSMKVVVPNTRHKAIAKISLWVCGPYSN